MFQGAAWVYLLSGGGAELSLEDRVSASSGIASGTSSQPWLEDQVRTIRLIFFLIENNKIRIVIYRFVLKTAYD